MVHGIDVSEKAVREHGGGNYFQDVIQNKLDSISDDALIIFDDYPDSARSLYKHLERTYNSMLRVARHRSRVLVLGSLARLHQCEQLPPVAPSESRGVDDRAH